MIRRHNPPLVPAPVGRYAHGLEIAAGRLLFISGQIPEDLEGNIPLDFSAQCRRMWFHIGEVLRQAGLEYLHLVKVVTFLTDRSQAAANSAIRQEVLGTHEPALTVIVAQTLDPRWLLEIEAIAAFPDLPEREPLGLEQVSLGTAMSPDEIEREILEAFATVPPPPSWCLTSCREGEEPELLEREFQGRTDRYELSPELLDQAPDGFASALSFFSDEALRFYLPAYMLADLRGQLQHTDMLFYLTNGFDEESKRRLVNPRRYGARTWFEEASHRWSTFDVAQSRAVVHYLEWKLPNSPVPSLDGPRVQQALANYWLPRAGVQA